MTVRCLSNEIILSFFRKCKCTIKKCLRGSSCSTHQECGKNGLCNSKSGCICKCKQYNSVCTNHQDCGINSWCKPKSGLCGCKNPKKCIYGSACNGDQHCGKNGSCNPKFGCICKCKPSGSVCANHQDCDIASWCNPKSELCACKNPEKCIHGSACNKSQHCGKNGSCNPKFGCICNNPVPVPEKCIEDSTCDVLGTEDECPNGVCYEG